MQIGIAGLGRMGAAVAARLIEVGHTVSVWNRSPEKTKPLVQAGAKQAATPEDLAEHSEAVITLLTDANAIDHVYNGEHGFLSGDIHGKLFIEMSTVRPEVSIALAKVVRASGAAFVECPVGGTTGPARQGKLFGFMGAEPADAERARPILDQLCRRLEHVGPVGNGALAKFAINMPLMIYYQALGEALSMARPIGLDPERLMDIICDTSGAPAMMKARGPVVAKMMKGEDAAVTFDLAGCIKDLQSMQAEGGARGLSLPLVQLTLACMQESASKGLGDKEAATHSVYWSKK
ncbi:MAG: 3-hydroxyisobutyrate dehydrogenase [Hyphomicrobiales bacterium]|nr:3-hydroxyisobutyrate dehydrogenase [Hyphomicrobiales bacterium]